MPHVLIISLGPIQDFIAAARRCRDLWYGSWLLSELSKATARGVADVVEFHNLVFPGALKKDELDPGSKTSVANKIVAVIPDTLEPQAVAEVAKKAMRNRLKGLANKTFDCIQTEEERRGLADFFQRQTAVAQVKDLIEFLWVSAHYPSDGSYSEGRKRAEELLANRKRTMVWGPVPWAPQAGVPKSSLDGQRESVIHENAFEVIRNEPTPDARLRKVYGLKTNERLCGVGILKRLGEWEGHKDHRFLSTPHLASMPLLQRMKSNREVVAPAWKKYLSILKELGADLEQTAARWDVVIDHYDGQLLFETRLEEWFDEQPEKRRKENVKRAQEALGEFFEETRLPRPMPYFGILLADGDHMGKAIAARDTEKDHRDLSQELDLYAQNAKAIVEKVHFGELIYSGGDDVLAFVPLNRAIECARALADDFATRLEKFRHPEGKPTLSVGIAICHFMDSMGDAFNLARRAERKAKVERNSLAIIVDKRSGPSIAVSGPWGTVDAHVLRFADLHRRDDIPDGVAFELQELNTLLTQAEKENKFTIKELIKKETARILGRKRAQRGEMPLDDDMAQELLDVPHELAERLIVARLIAQAKDIAEGELSKGGAT